VDKATVSLRGMIYEVKGYRMASGDLEGRLVIKFRPLDHSNSNAIALLSKMQEFEQEVDVTVGLDK